jgi:2-C-methyl-D-erythritol 4-phosphate cytidylyltransferase
LNTKAKYVIIVAGGSGSRMSNVVPKQFLLLKGLPILMHTINRFAKIEDLNIILVLPDSQTQYWKELCEEYNFHTSHAIAIGGSTRFESVKNGLALVTSDSLIAVHDGVRPLISIALINRIFEATNTEKAVILVTPMSESLRHIKDKVSIALNRNEYRLVQTPQCFKSEILKQAYLQTYTDNFTDDASVVESMGIKVYLIEGEVSNIKITTPQDLIIAEALLSADYLK